MSSRVCIICRSNGSEKLSQQYVTRDFKAGGQCEPSTDQEILRSLRAAQGDTNP